MNRHARMRGKDTDIMTNRETSDKDAVAEQGAHVALENTSSKKGAPKPKKNTKSVKPKKGAGTKRVAKRQRKSASRSKGKGARILEMVGRVEGATLAEIMKATAWQAHSVRGFLSTAARKRQIEIESSKSDTRDRTYRIVK
jgi:hypothetical protein